MPAQPIIPASGAEGSDKSSQEPAKIEVTVPPATGASLDDKVRFEADLVTFRALSEVCVSLSQRVNNQIETKRKQTPARTQSPSVQLILLDGVSITAFEAEAAFQ